MMEAPSKLLGRESMRMPIMGSAFPVMSALCMSNDIFNLDPKFKPKGSVRRMQMVIETIKLQIEEDTDDTEFSLDDLECADWRGLPNRVKQKAVTVTQRKNPHETFWEGEKDEFIPLPQLNYADIRTELDSSKKDDALFFAKTEENNVINLKSNCLSDESYTDLDENETTIDLNNSYKDEIESISSNSSITLPSPKKLHDHYEDHPKHTDRLSREIKNKEYHPLPTLRLSEETETEGYHRLHIPPLSRKTRNKKYRHLSTLRLSGETETEQSHALPTLRLSSETETEEYHSLPTPPLSWKTRNKEYRPPPTLRLSGETKKKDEYPLTILRLSGETKTEEYHPLPTVRLSGETETEEYHPLPNRRLSGDAKKKEDYDLTALRLSGETETEEVHPLPTLSLTGEVETEEDHPLPTLSLSGKTKHKVLRARSHFTTNPTFHVVKLHVVPSPPEISSEPQKKRMRSKVDPTSILQSRDYFKGLHGGTCTCPLQKPRVHFASNVFVEIHSMLPINQAPM
ncbi:unnamed protein product [Orchesella dallaii]|uniref:Uncharacterized protein n=1 Tax=Orchesella dallaii TaxID=48710 RepID=A0ABP1QTC0_9HEXA